jgi:hypothetical protein
MKTKQKRNRRARLLRKNGSRCYLCHETFLANQLTLDHLKPRSRGGSNKLENLRLACFPCNNRRSDRLERSHPFEPPKRMFSKSTLPSPPTPLPSLGEGSRNRRFWRGEGDGTLFLKGG